MTPVGSSRRATSILVDPTEVIFPFTAEVAMSPALRWSRNVSGCPPTSRYLRDISAAFAMSPYLRCL